MTRPVPAPDPGLKDSAHSVGLRYVVDQMPGIRRVGSGKGFRYFYATGDLVQDEAVLRRIRSLAIPPAWTEVWICPDPAGHLQATGRDAKGRKQSRYHPRWREVRDETKYARMLAFARALPGIRRRVAADLKLRGLQRNRVLATVVRLLEVSHIRVGNEEYARENESFGLTTMHNRHADVRGDKVRFRFRGKSGKWHEVDVQDRQLAQLVRKCQELPGQELFEYMDSEGREQDVKSEDVNEYLREITGQDFTAKDFRTWAGTVLAATALTGFARAGSQREAKKNLVKAIEIVAARLGNTPAVCRKCYIHPEVIGAYTDGTLLRSLQHRAQKEEPEAAGKLKPEEAAVLGLLEQRVKRASEDLGTTLEKSVRLMKGRARAKRGKPCPSRN